MTLPPTLTLSSASKQAWGAVVVGAGPAGSLAARELARRGVRVLLVDRAAFPRGKVCGCCLNGRALATLRAVGLGELPVRRGAVPLRTVRMGAYGKSVELRLPQGMALSRVAFDADLVTAAVESGADFLPRTRAALVETDRADGERRSVVLHGSAAEVRVAARVVLAADGLGGNLLARAGLSEAPPIPGARIGAGVVLEAPEAFYRPGTVYLAYARAGYVGLVRLEDGRLDVATALDADAVRAAGGPGPTAAGVLAEMGWPIPPRLPEQGWRGTAALTRRAAHLAAHRVFALGDAAGYVEPFTGEGMAWALAAGAVVAPLAACAAERWRPEMAQRWAATYRRVVGRRQYVCRAVTAVLRRPALARALLQVVARAPFLAAPVVRYVNGPREG